MFDGSSAIEETDACAICGDFASAGRYVQADGRSLLAFCSSACLAAGLRAQRHARGVRWIRAARAVSLVLVVIATWLAPRERLWPRRTRAPSAVPILEEPPRRPALPAGWFGPEWPPSEESVLALLGRDAWIHPLAGPSRRMPRSDARVFGADRPGNRAIECRNGHCGVDLGGELWGEHVRAVHDGVVDYVQRGPNPDHGGRFVRLAHHEGTVFTQYFHLAAIPRGLERGTVVKGGQVIGLLGDSGVKESQPHLHFAVSVRGPSGHERYVDPEPLIALWPLHVPVAGSEIGLVTITAPPGVPLGSAPRRRKGAPRKAAAGEASQPEGAPADGEGATDAPDVEPSAPTGEPE